MTQSAAVAALGLRNPPASGLFVMLLSVDVILTVLYISALAIGRPGGFVFDLGADRSYGEFFQYAKDLWAMILLAVLLWRRRAAIYGAWFLVVAYFFADDAFVLHERAGWALRAVVPGSPRWADHAGELVLVGVVGLILAALVCVTHIRAPREDRAVSAILVALFALLVFFGIVVDTLPQLLFPGSPALLPLTALEDSGEMVTLSLIVAFTFAVAFSRHQPIVGRPLGVLVDRRRTGSA